MYVSLDADVLDPFCMPNACCPEPLGMQSGELLAVCQWIGSHCQVVGGDLCAVLPARRSGGSEQALMRCLCTLLEGGPGANWGSKSQA